MLRHICFASCLLLACNAAKVDRLGAQLTDTGGLEPEPGNNEPRESPAPLTEPSQSVPATNANDVAEDPNRPTTGPLVRLQGRFDTSNPNGTIAFGWPASSIWTRFEGTGLAIKLGQDGNMSYQGNVVHNWYDVFVDGALSKTFEVTQDTNTYEIAQNLPYGDHAVRVSKRTEPQMGTGLFYGFVPLAGQNLLPAPLAKLRQIEFVGDSITAGYGADGNVATGNGCPFTAQTENADVTYAAQTAAALDAEFIAVAFSGKGMVQNNDCFGDPVQTLPVLYPKIIPRNANSVYDFSKWTPQVVVINLGTNDYNQNNGCSVPQSATFVAGTTAFLKTVRGNYPHAMIFVTIGPTLGPPQLPVVQQNLQTAVASVVAAGDSNVQYIALSQANGQLGYGCAGHPNVANHAIVAQAVTAAIRQRLGW